MVNRAELELQIFREFKLNSYKSQYIFNASDEFHDADLCYLKEIEGEFLQIHIRTPIWNFLDSDYSVDQLSLIQIHIERPRYTENWGGSDEITKSVIYECSLKEDSIRILTGDGGRTAQFSAETSHLTITTTPEILQLVGID